MIRKHLSRVPSVALAILLLAVQQAKAVPETICTLVAEAETGRVLVEEGDCDTRVTPASTFKVPLAVMAFEEGILQDSYHPVMSYRAGDPDWGGAKWTRDTNPSVWIRHSVVWYSQRITHAMGADLLSRHARAFGYGNADFTGDPGFDNGLERAWIASSLKVSPREQAEFIRAFVMGRLPVSDSAIERARELLLPREAGAWTVRGKTGAAYPRRADRSFDYTRGWGWFTGWAEREGRTVVFVALTQARERMQGSPGILTRDAFLRRWPGLAGTRVAK